MKLKLRNYSVILIVLAFFLPSAHAAVTTLQNNQTVVFDAPDADLLALECCGGDTPPALRPQNGSGFGGSSQSWDDTDCTEAQGINYSTSNGGFIPSDGEVWVIRTGAGNFFKLRYINTGSNPTNDTNISFEWEQITSCSLPPAPTADFTFDNSHDVAVQFTDQSTGTVSSRSWDFDDGSNTSTFTNPLYAFSGAGTFNVCLTVTNTGGSDTACKDVTVTLDLTAVTVTGGGAIDFDSDSQGDLDTFSPSGCSNEFFAMDPLGAVGWAGLSKNYDNVVLADAQNASLSTSNFCHPSGTYFETLIVNTTSNLFYKVWIPQNTSSGIRFIFELLGEPPSPPTAGFTSSSYGLFAFFTDQSSDTTTNWSWDFGDGGTSSSANPSHQYASDGTYTVCLTASNAGGSNQTCQDITVSQVTTTQVDSNQTVDFDGDNQADLLVEKIEGCGTQAHRYVVQNGTQWSSITKFYPDVDIDDALSASYGTSPFCHPVSPFETMLLQTSSGSFVKAWTPEHTDSFVLFEFEILSPPEIELQGDGVTIDSGDTTPSAADHTDFGNVALSSNTVRTFTISNTDIGVLNLGTITFSGTNADDFIVSSAPAASVVGNSSTTFDVTFTPGAGGLRTATVNIPNNDDDDNENPYTFAIQGGGAAITVNPISGLTTTEAGGTDSFDVSLSVDPNATVTLPLSSSNTGEGTVPASLVFNPGDALTKTVTVSGVNDFVDDGDQNYTITVGAAMSTDTGFSDIDPPDVSATNQDNDTAGFTITESSGTTEVSEAGTTDTFDVVLTARPLSSVVITVTSADTNEAVVDQPTLTFTDSNWDQAQTVTVTGVDDVLEDGDQTTTVTLSIDAANSDDVFDSVADQTVSVTTIDDENDGDGVPSDVEDEAPNNGDGNFDGIPDRTQSNVASLPNAVTGDFITLQVSGDCTQIDAASTATEATVGDDPNYDYPLGLLSVELPCSSAMLTVFYHGQSTVLVGAAYRKYGPQTPTDPATIGFYTLPGVGFALSNGVMTASFTLSDGALGDDNTATGADDERIVDPGGPARSTLAPTPPASIPTMQLWGLGLLTLLLAGVLARARQRHRA